MNRITFITEFIPPYRITFYQKLFSHSDFSWQFIHGIKEKDDGRPGYFGNLSFENYPVPYKERKLGHFNIRWQRGVEKLVQSWNPDIVITQGIPSILTNWLAMNWARKNGAKTITWHCGWESQAGQPHILPIKQWVAKKYLGLVDHILAYSTKGANYLADLQGHDKNITICYNGIETDPLLEHEAHFRVNAKKIREKEQVESKTVFLYVGGMVADKKVPLLLSAFRELDKQNNVLLWAIGDGPDMPQVKAFAQSLNLKNVKFFDRIIDGVDAYFAAADYFVLPGVGGLALNQALFWEVPCVVSEADGTEDDLVFDNRTGFRFVPNNQKSLNNALKKCLALSNEQRRQFGQEGRKLVLERSNVNEMVKTFMATIQQLPQN